MLTCDCPFVVLTPIAPNTRKVCKGWRSIRQEPSLWRSMEFSHLRFSDAGLQALLLPGPRTPLPSPDVVEHLSLMGNKARHHGGARRAHARPAYLTRAWLPLASSRPAEAPPADGSQLTVLLSNQSNRSQPLTTGRER